MAVPILPEDCLLYTSVFNHTEFNNLDLNSADANFGQATTAYDPRTLQLGAKFHF